MTPAEALLHDQIIANLASFRTLTVVANPLFPDLVSHLDRAFQRRFGVWDDLAAGDWCAVKVQAGRPWERVFSASARGSRPCQSDASERLLADNDAPLPTLDDGRRGSDGCRASVRRSPVDKGRYLEPGDRRVFPAIRGRQMPLSGSVVSPGSKNGWQRPFSKGAFPRDASVLILSRSHPGSPSSG